MIALQNSSFFPFLLQIDVFDGKMRWKECEREDLYIFGMGSEEGLGKCGWNVAQTIYTFWGVNYQDFCVYK